MYGSSTIRPFVRVGVTFLSDDGVSIATSFLGAPAGFNPFRISTKFDDVFADLETGINLIGAKGLSLKLNYEGNFGEHTQIHSGGIKLSVTF
jgi:outer membrane autotransporter protein